MSEGVSGQDSTLSPEAQMQLQRTFCPEAHPLDVPVGLCFPQTWGLLVLGHTPQPYTPAICPNMQGGSFSFQKSVSQRDQKQSVLSSSNFDLHKNFLVVQMQIVLRWVWGPRKSASQTSSQMLLLHESYFA